MTDAIEQAQYQVRFDWGVDGARAIGGRADVLVLVDVLRESHVDVDALAGTAGVVIDGSLRNAAAVARWALDAQADKGDRFTIAIVAVGETRENGRIRFALEDFLGAGAIIDALASVGIDYCSPEAAAAAAAFTGLRNATRHLIGASTSGREAAARGDRAVVDAALESNSSDEVTVLRELRTGA